MPDNEIKLITTSPSFLNWPKSLGGGAFLILTGILLIFLGAFSTVFNILVALVGAGFMAWAALVVANTQYCVTNNRVLIDSGLLKGRSAEAELGSVDVIRVRRTHLQEALGLGDLVIECGAGRALVFEGVEDPEKLRERILALK